MSAVVIGAPGAGKSTVGALLATALGTSFLDTDQAIEDAAGKSVAEIFFDDGEAAFRALEAATVSTALAGDGGVVSLGGGAVMNPATRAELETCGAPIVWLQVSMPDAVRRVGLARDRPVLALNPRAQLHALLAERSPVYEALATFAVDTDGREPAAIVADIMAGITGTS